MRMQLALMAIVAGMILGQPVMAQEKGGPFGIYMGMPAAELIDLGATVDTGFYSFDHSPKGFGELSSFDVLALEEQGACMIEAAANGLTEKQGEQRYRSIHDKLSKALGPPQEATNTIEVPELTNITVARWLSDTGFGAPMEKAKLVALVLNEEIPDDQSGVEPSGFLSLVISFTELGECFGMHLRSEISKAFNQLAISDCCHSIPPM